MENQKFLTKEKVKQILDNAPSGVDKPTLLRNLVEKRGYTLEGFTPPTPKAAPEKESFLERGKYSDTPTTEIIGGAAKALGGDLAQRGKNIATAFKQGQVDDQGKSEINPLSSGLQIAGQVGGAVEDVFSRAIEATGLDKKVIKVLSKVPTIDTDTGKPTTLGAFYSKPETQADLQKLSGVIKQVKEKHPELAGNIEAITNLALATIDVATAGIGEGVAKNAAETAVKTAGEVGTKIADVGEQAIKSTGEALTKASDNINAATGDMGNEITSSLKSTVNPENIMQRVARIPKAKQATFKKMTGESVGEYLTKRGIYGNEEEILTKLYDRFTSSKSTADDALAQLEGTYKPKQVGTAIDELLQKEVAVSSPGAMSKDIKRVMQLKNKFKAEGLDMSEINEVKRLYERNVKVDFLKQNLPKDVTRANNVDTAIREWQFTQAEKLGLKNLPDINKETRAAKQLLDDLGKELAGKEGNNALGLTDAVLISGGDPASIGMYIAKKVFSSSKLQSKIAEKLSKGVNKIGLPKAEFGKPKPDLTDFLSK